MLVILLIRLNHVTKGLKCTVYAKVEFFNPAGSIKDRVAKQILKITKRSDSKRRYDYWRTSGNTGGWACVNGRESRVQSNIRHAGQAIRREASSITSMGGESCHHPNGCCCRRSKIYYKVSERLVQETENSCYANQYHNPSNPKAHYLSTGPELWDQLDGNIDVFIAGVGTGGMIAGTGRYLKEQRSDIQVVGIDPVGSLITTISTVVSKLNHIHMY